MTELATGFRADILTCVSRRAATALPTRTVVVPCGVDLSTFTPGGRKSERPSVLFVGILDSRKRGDLLVDVFVTKVKKRYPTAVLNIVRESKQLMHKDVNIHGFVDQQILVDLYRSSWVFCLPSSYEGFGVPYIEAMGCGTAVVATANDGSLDVLENGKYGIISSQDSLGDDLISLLADNNRLRLFESQGLQRSKDFAWSTIVSKYVNLVNGYHGL
jgi:glycosyltransferase involved in cell wall biosynthesis